MNIALLTAAGSGVRMHQEIPKQFMHVDNMPLIIHTLRCFETHPGVDAIIVVTLDSWTDVLWAYAKQLGIAKLKWVIPGGDTGQESILLGLREIARHCSPDDAVIIHDGNRPMVSAEVISDGLATYRERGCSVAAIPCVEAVFRCADGVSSTESLPREELWRTQTPHIWPLGELLWAHDEAAKRGITNTAASCTLMQKLGQEIFFSRGSEMNLKITTVEDLRIFEALLHTRQEAWLKSAPIGRDE